MLNARRGVVRRKFKQSEPLRLALLRSGFEQSGTTSTLLLELFIEDGGRCSAAKVVARGLCKDGEFWAWRKELVEKGWLQWSEQQSDKGQYFPGKKLMPYINKEKLSSKEIATVDQIHSLDKKIDSKADRAEVNELRQQVNDLKEWVMELKAASEPPDTDEKKARREKATARLAAIAMRN